MGTLGDLDWIAKNPQDAFEVHAERAGIKGKPTPEVLPERSAALCGWTLRMLDKTKPSEP